MQVRYQAALRPEIQLYQMGDFANDAQRQHSTASVAQYVEEVLDFLAHSGEIRFADGRRAHRFGWLDDNLVKAVARATDRESLIIQEVANAPDKQDFVMLVITPIAAPLHRFELRELLFPISQHVRLNAAQVAYLTDGEVTLGRYRWQCLFRTVVCVHRYCSYAQPSPSAFATRGKSLRDVR